MSDTPNTPTPPTPAPTPTTPRAESTRGLSRVFKTILFVAVIGTAGSLFWFGNLMSAVAGVYSSKVEPMPFDREVWMANIATESHESVRLRMADDLVTNHLAAGLHESRLYLLLGYPDQPLPGYDLMYFLGTATTDPSDNGLWLAIKLNTRGEIEFLKITSE
jgi:hypothetical protein